MQNIVIEGGGKLALAMPRSSGKTALAVALVEYALCYGHCRYVILIGASKPEANKLIESIKYDLNNNETLLEDFPEVFYPFRQLGGQGLRARGQLYLGELTGIEWKPDSVTFAKIPGSAASGASVLTVGIKGAIRGKQRKMPDGRIARPDIVILDDPQTDADAVSPRQVEKLEHIIDSAIEGLAGPAEELAMLMTCTVIQEGDLADKYLDHNVKSQWGGMRFKMVETMPERMDLWEEYKERRKTDAVDATQFYKHNKTAMREGAKVNWEARYSDNAIDALQFAMNKWADNFYSFMSECQNEPVRADKGQATVPAKIIRTRLNGFDQQQLPAETAVLTGFIDVHDDLLYYAVCAWADDFTGYVIDYGTYPKQRRRFFSKGDSGLLTLDTVYGGRADGAVQAGLVDLLKDLMSGGWLTVEGDKDGTESRLFDKLFIDANYKTDIVANAIRLACGRTNVVVPGRGKGIKSTHTPMANWKKKPGEVFGNHWLNTKNPKGVRQIVFDANHWKSQVHSGLALAAGNRGGLSFWGRDAEAHHLISEHLAAEQPKLVKSGENEVNEWFALPGRDNHYFDCVVGNMVAASVCGIRPQEEQAARTNLKRRRSV
ncbi:hypothetical protein FACS1894214_1990 [Planctomycetales bacterium]|nr:hypothetical protein FACS1894214_1990 [Planctomycetales bacterium]